MPSYLNLRHAGKIKQFKWPLEPNSALQTIANAFLIKPETILGFKDKDGKIYQLDDLFNDPEETNKQSFMLLVEGDERKSSPSRLSRSINSPEPRGGNNETPQNLGLIMISNYFEFERTFLQNSALSIIVAVNQKQQFDEISSKLSPIQSQFAEKFEFFSYLWKGSNDDLITSSNAFPLILVYSGSKRLLEIPLNTNQKSLINLLERIQSKDSRTGGESPSGSPSRQENESTQILLKHLEDTFGQNEISGLDYYFLRSAILERKSEVISVFTRYLKARDSDQLKSELRELTSPEINKRPETASSKQKQAGFQPLQQNYMRPDTSQGRNKPRNKEISSAQEKFIQIIGELERKSLLTEHSASLIKSLILEEHPDVLRVLNSYDAYDEQELSYRLVRLAEKLSPYIVRPTSPLPKRDELIRLVNNLVRRRLKDDNQLLLLNKLILEGDELLYSTFEVFESDRDEEDLLDTLIRIVYRYKKMGKFTNDLYASPFYSSQKIPLVDNEQELFKERKAANLERPGTSGGQSYFLESRSKSRKEARETRDAGFERVESRKGTRDEQGFERELSRKDVREESFERNPSRKETRESAFERDGSRKGTREEQNFIERIPYRKETFSPLEQPEGYDLSEVLKNSSSIKNLPADEYGAVFWMAKNKASIIKDVITDHGGVDAIERAVPSILLLANKELSHKLKEKFDEKQRVYINENKKIKNSATYAAFQCFKYDHDLDGLSKSLEEICKNMPRAETKTPSRSYNKNEHLVTPDAKPKHSRNESGKDHSMTSSQNFADLAVIKEEIKIGSNTDSRNIQSIENDKNAFIGSDSSLGGDTGGFSQNFQSVTSATTGLDHRPAGSKYTPLLNRDSRADSFKGMFQLKLISSDNQAVNAAANNNKAHVAETKPEIHESEGTKNSLDAHLNVIIPQKSEINPFTQTFIDRFYESQGGAAENLDKFRGILTNIKWLTPEEIQKLEYLYDNFYYELFEVIYNFDINKDLKQLESRLKEDILPVDLDNISLASASPRERKRMGAYHSFKALLQNLKNGRSISEKQYKTYLYLYTEEDVTILATYEVYQYTHDIADFIDTLLLIEKVQFFKNESKYFEDISNFSDYVEYQLKIIFSLKRYLTVETRATLEKIIRAGDTTVMQIYQNYKKGRDGKNKSNLIHQLVNFAEENMEIIKNYEKKIVQNKLNSETKNVRRRELIENFECTNLLPEVKYFELLYQSIDNDEELIHSIFEVYDMTKDKIDFIENITLVYKFLYKRNIINMLKLNQERLGIPDATIEFVENMIKRKENAILGPIEFYYATKDERDFLDTVSLLIQAKRRRKGSNV